MGGGNLSWQANWAGRLGKVLAGGGDEGNWG
jgi:hypothetical protein